MESRYELTPEEERLIEDFIFELYMKDGPDDMFPPDAGSREPITPLTPTDSAAGRVALFAATTLEYLS